VLIAAAVAFGLLEIVAALAPSYWLFALLMVPIGIAGLTVNVTANTAVQMGTDPAMRGRVMALFMMVFMGGTPLGAPIVGWITDAYGPRVGFALGGVISALAAATIGLALARVGDLRLSVGWNHGHPSVRFVPRERATGDAARVGLLSSHGPAGHSLRLFAAVLPPEDVTAELASVVDELRNLPGADRGLRWTGRPGWHFTLAFYGEVDEDSYRSCRPGWSGRRGGRTPSRSLRGGGRSGAARCGRGRRGTYVRCGCSPSGRGGGAEGGRGVGEHRRYRAHLTVARSREAMDVTAVRRPCSTGSRGGAGRWRAGLMRSNLPRSGCRGSSRGTRCTGGRPPGTPRRGWEGGAVRLGYVDPKTRNRIMAGVLVLLFVVVGLAAAIGK
jgi:hypothetical protein